MAVVECIPEKKQTPSAQKGVIDYCIQPLKTYDNDEQLAYVSGYNCIPDLANESFLATQKVFGHAPDGVRFYHYVQSFRIGEEITPLQYILRDKHGEGNPPQIPDHIRMEIARCLLPDIIAFCESEEGKREFEEWKKQQSVVDKRIINKSA